MGSPDREALLKHFVEEDTVLRAYVFAATCDYHETNDVLQEVWRVLCAKIDAFDDSRPFRPWAMGVTRLQVLKWRQSKARSREILAPDTIELLADTAEQCAAEIDIRTQYLRECLGRLTLAARRILRMKYFEGLRATNIAAQLGRSVSSVEMTLVRGRRALRRCVERKIAASEVSAA